MYGAFPVCRNYTVRAFLRKPTACKRCSVKTDSRLAGTFGFQYDGKYIRPFGLFVKTVFCTGDGGWDVFAGCPRLSEQMERDRNGKRKFRRFEPWKMRASGWKLAVLSRFSSVLLWKKALSARLCKKEKSSKPACLLCNGVPEKLWNFLGRGGTAAWVRDDFL